MHHFFRILACYAVLKCKMSIDLFGKNILYHNIQLLPSKYTTISSVLALLVVIIMQCKGCYVVQLLYHFNNLEALSRQHFVILLLLYTRPVLVVIYIVTKTFVHIIPYIYTFPNSFGSRNIVMGETNLITILLSIPVSTH